MTTPGFSLVNTPEAVEFCQQLQLPTQRGLLLGNAKDFANDSEVSMALININGKAMESAEILGRLTLDETRTTPLKHEAASKLAGKLITAAEGTQALLHRRSADYQTASQDLMGEKLKVNPERFYFYDRITDWIAREAKNGDGGYTNIREAITEDPDFAITMYNLSHRLLGLPDDQAMKFKTKIIEHWVPQAMTHIDTSVALSQLAKRYPKFVANVKSSFYSTMELAKVRTRVDIAA